jgi:hypothetical protein
MQEHTYFLRFHSSNKSLASCPAAELVSVSVELLQKLFIKTIFAECKKVSKIQKD